MNAALVRHIAKARHLDAATGKPCSGAMSAMLPRRPWLAPEGFALPDGWQYREGYQGYVWTGDACPGCGKPDTKLRAEAVEGVTKAHIRCDARCQGARGRHCECSCGGKNHGAGFDRSAFGVAS